jgi:glycosyltransferase involved in cell wall biosynthesis
LSVILPVHNAQRELPGLVGELLEHLPELTSDFEVVIVDQGSTDQTEELAVELARQYPQVRAVRRADRQGMDAAFDVGFVKTRGDVVFVQDPRQPLRGAELRRMWQMRYDDALIAMRSRPRQPQGLVSRLSHWGVALKNAGPAPESRLRIAPAGDVAASDMACRHDEPAPPRRQSSSFLAHLVERRR